ncbi:hypothetical protein GF354_00410, partial [Candidatus Peregrinibacteria bacterium]|nr:hypothetical protein [Candidatus Peregrinibacteria bacterium]
MKKVFIALISLMAITTIFTSSALAHGPETYTCERANDGWNSNTSGSCNANGTNPNLLNGITRDSSNPPAGQNYPNGLCFPSFNNYTDSWAVTSSGDQAYNNDGELMGIDPYFSPLFVNERDFLKAAVLKKADLQSNPTYEPVWADYSNNAVVEEGDVITFLMYIHNNGDPCFNQNGVGYNATNGAINTTSKNTKTSLIPSTGTGTWTTENGVKTFDLTQTTNLNANIWSDNAINNFNQLAAVTNGVNVTPANNADLVLEFDKNSEQFYYVDIDEASDGTPLWVQIEPNNVENFFSNGGMPLSTYDEGARETTELKGSSGDFYACEPYVGLLQFDLKVVAPPSQSLTCEGLSVAKEIVTIGGKSAVKIIPGLDFGAGNEVPDGTHLEFEITSGAGKFYRLSNGQYLEITETLPLSGNQGYIMEYGVNPTTIYYSGEGTVQVRTYRSYPDSPTFYQGCSTTLNFQYYCEDIEVNYRTPIPVGTYTELNASAYGNMGSLFEGTDGTVTYSVESGHGFFKLDTDGCEDWEQNLNQEATAYEMGPTVRLVNNRLIGTAISNKLVAQEKTNINRYLKADVLAATDPAQPSPGDLQPNPVGGQASCTGLNSITVPYGTPVYFFATQEGSNVMTVSTDGTDEADCEVSFTITETTIDQNICTELEAHIEETTLPFTDTPAYIVYVDGLSWETTDLGSDYYFRWFTDDSTGRFYKFLSENHIGDLNTAQFGQTMTMSPDENGIVYYVPGTLEDHSIRVEFVDSSIPVEERNMEVCTAEFPLTFEPEVEVGVCLLMGLGFSEADATINGQKVWEMAVDLGFDPAGTPEGTYLSYTTDDPNGIFYRYNGIQYRPQAGTTVTQNLNSSGTFSSMYYVGTGNIIIRAFNEDGEPWDNCKTPVSIPEDDLVCDYLEIERTAYGDIEREAAYELDPDLSFVNA